MRLRISTLENTVKGTRWGSTAKRGGRNKRRGAASVTRHVLRERGRRRGTNPEECFPEMPQS